MNQNSSCPKCAANMEPHDFVCDYCGHVLFDRVKNTDGLGADKDSFDQGIEIIKENINALHDIPKPSSGKTITSAIRLILALYTFGIILIFWRKPKKRFSKENYDKLKSIISRNISFLKISSAGSNDLTARIKVLEDELSLIDKQVKMGIYSKTITTAAIVVLFLVWIIYIANQGPVKHSTYQVMPYDTIIQGNLAKNVAIAQDTTKIMHTPSGAYEEWELLVKLKVNRLEGTPSTKIKYNCYLTLTDNNGVAILGFKEAEMDNSSYKKLISNLLNAKFKQEYYKFLIKNDLNYSQFRDTIPVNAVKFIIQIDTLY